MRFEELCIIPARAGSLRIPHKNKMEFCGKPIIEYSIDFCLANNITCIVTTDDNGIIDLATQLGVGVHVRTKYTDHNSVLYDVVYNCLADMRLDPERILLLYPCAPFVTIEQIDGARYLYNAGGYDCIYPVQRLGDDPTIKMVGDKIYQNSDWGEKYKHAGQWFYFNADKIKQKQKIVTDNCGFILLSEWDAQDINTIDDFLMAKIKWEKV